MTAAAVPSSQGALRAATWSAFVHVAALAVQLALALALLSGAPVFGAHSALAWAVSAAGVLQAMAVVALHGRAGAWVTLLGLALPALEALQFWLGRTAQTGAHALLALFIWGFGLALLIRLCAPELRVPRAAA